MRRREFISVDVIVAFGTPRAKAAQRATKTIPIVAILISDPTAAEPVTNLANPGGLCPYGSQQ